MTDQPGHGGGDLHGRAFFIVDQAPRIGPFVLDGPEGRHAATVLRVRTGERIVLTDGAGRLGIATVRSTGRAEVSLSIDEVREQPAAQPRVVLVQALTKSDRGELAVDLATEAGVDEIVPWAAQRCVARWDADRASRGQQRWQQAAIQAAKQARRAWVPPVRPVATTVAVCELISRAAGALVLHEAESAALQDVSLPADGDLVVVVGPEGGVAPAEIEAFAAAGARPVRLGPQVLRSAVAGAVALGALGVLTGRWSSSAAGQETVA